MVEEKIVEERGTTLNIVIGLGGNGTLLADRFARSLRSKPDDLLIYACDTHDKCPEVGGKTHEFVEYIPWDLPTKKQVKTLGVTVDPNHIGEVKQIGEGVLRYRDYSRAAFYLNREDVLTRIKNEIKKRKKDFMIGRLKFTLLTPLGGGTGSGSLIDFADEIKRYFGKKYNECTIDAFLVLPEGFIMRDERGIICDLTTNEERPAFYNTFAALLELREIIADKDNSFHAINLLSSYTLGGLNSTDSVVVRFLHDLFGNKLGEIGNIFHGMDSRNGFITMIPAIVEFPIGLIQDYISVSNDIKELEKQKTEKEKELWRGINREGDDPEKHGSLINSIRKFAHDVKKANNKLTDIEKLKDTRLVPFRAMLLHNREVELKEVYEGIFGTDRAKWDNLMDKYINIENDLVKLTDEKFIQGIGITRDFLVKGRNKGVDVGDSALKSSTKGLIDPIIDERGKALEIKKHIDNLNNQIENLLETKDALRDSLVNPLVEGTIPLKEDWIKLFEDEKIKLGKYMPGGGGVLMDLFEELLGSKEASDFYVSQVNKSLLNLEYSIKEGFYKDLVDRDLEKFGYKGKELIWKLVVATCEDNYEKCIPVKKLVDKMTHHIGKDLLGVEVNCKSNVLDKANTSLIVYFIIGRMELNQFPEWETCKERYMRETENVNNPTEAHAWGLEGGIWTKEHVEKVIKEIESAELKKN